MPITRQDQVRYLTHIGLTLGDITLDPTGLKKIVEGHIFHIPYETLNVHDHSFDAPSSQPRSNLELHALLEKALNNRGGRCVETNTLLQEMLRSFGFNVKPIVVDTLYHEEKLSIDERSKHSMAIVTIESQQYHVDAAFGSLGLLSPTLIQHGNFQQFSERFSLGTLEKEPYDFVLFAFEEDKKIPLYGYNIQTPEASLSNYQSIDEKNREPRNPGAYFSELFLCTKPVLLTDGSVMRETIYNTTYLCKIANRVLPERTEVIDSQLRLHVLLKEKFKISMPKTHYLRHYQADQWAYLEGIKPPALRFQPYENTRYQSEKYKKLDQKAKIPSNPKLRVVESYNGELRL